MKEETEKLKVLADIAQREHEYLLARLALVPFWRPILKFRMRRRVKVLKLESDYAHGLWVESIDQTYGRIYD
jgi:hypothetical protein